MFERHERTASIFGRSFGELNDLSGSLVTNFQVSKSVPMD